MTCPLGYFCQFSQSNKQFQCCGIPSDCPHPMVAFIGISGEHQHCSMSGGQMCPEGYSCVKGKKGEEICCAGGEACEVTQVSVDGRCLPLQHIGNRCEHTSQCLGGSFCIENACQCPSGMVEEKQRCVSEIKSCASNQVLFDDECFPVVSLGRACVHSIQCRGGGKCEEGVCTCPSNTVRKLERCEQKERIVVSTSPSTSLRPAIDGTTDQKDDKQKTAPATGMGTKYSTEASINSNLLLLPAQV
ncbi:unnamed protein product [Strongylus vulgaris]|uniref:EB domain-containing protein n=1 Tax=Strongylus vulgaris TaxID=40348 RepID=A0A3P7IHR6_STRVU|nr:unnamed protein product [Strongylus vulgaris]